MSSDFSFFNMPVAYDKKDYSDAIKGIVRKYSGIKGLKSVYNWGSASAPGISDIDLVMVFSGNIKKPLPLSRRSFHFLGSKTKYLVTHPFVFISEPDFRDVRYMYYDTRLELVHGEKIALKQISERERHHSYVSLLNDIIIRHYPRDFMLQSASKEIDVRNTLLRLNSLKYTVSIIESLTKEKDTWWNDKIKSIASLRETWFSENDFESLASLNNDAVEMTLQLAEAFRDFVIRNNVINVKSGSKIVYDGIKNRTIFVREWDKAKALASMMDSAEDGKKFYSILPIELAPQLIEYSRGRGRISSYIKNNMSGRLDYKLGNKSMIRKRIDILNGQAETAFKLKHSDFAAFFDFGYRNTAGINNWALMFLDRLRF